MYLYTWGINPVDGLASGSVWKEQQDGRFKFIKFTTPSTDGTIQWSNYNGDKIEPLSYFGEFNYDYAKTRIEAQRECQYKMRQLEPVHGYSAGESKEPHPQLRL